MDDLEEVKANLQKQIKDIDNRLNDLYKTKHELAIENAGDGYPGQTYSNVVMADVPMRTGQFDTLAIIPKNTKLLITAYEKANYKITYAGITGYVPAYLITLDDRSNKEILVSKAREVVRLERQAKIEEQERASQARIKEQERARQIRIKEQERARQIRENARADEIRKKYSPADAQKIIDRKIWIGMTKEMLVDSWGRLSDDKINRTVSSRSIREQWVYSSTYVYLVDGIVTSWQD